MYAYARQPALAGVLALCGLGWAAVATQAATLTMKVNGFTNPPVGYVEFCRGKPDECGLHGGDTAMVLGNERWRDLQEVNSFVNHIVIPETDAEQYHSEEVWALPEVYGDCEDYVLLKRKWLIERGWPTGALLVTVVFDEVGDGHAVLITRTDRGELVLDNKTDEIRPWYATAYRFVKRQSITDPNRWVSLGDPRWTASSTAAPK